LDNANLEGAEIPHLQFGIKSGKNINLSNVDFKNESYMFWEIDFTGANFKGIKNTKNLQFTRVILDNANFEDAEIPHIQFGIKSGKNINFKGADFNDRIYNFPRSTNITRDDLKDSKKNRKYNFQLLISIVFSSDIFKLVINISDIDIYMKDKNGNTFLIKFYENEKKIEFLISNYKKLLLIKDEESNFTQLNILIIY